MATLLLVRHGEAEGNGSHRFIGQTPVKLTETGERQAEALTDRLMTLPITRVVSSDLTRTIATIAPLAERTGLPIETDERLREIDNGEWTGLLPGEIAAAWPKMWADYVGGEDVPRPGGERWKDVSDRVIPVAQELLAEQGTIVVSSHGGPVLLLAMWAIGAAVTGNVFLGRLASLDNASLTVIGPGPRLVSFNDVGHLLTAPDQRLPFE